MATFKVGQRVRVVGRESALYGKEATVTGSCFFKDTRPNRAIGVVGEYGYHLAVDGIGPRWPVSKKKIGLPARFLAPLTDPGCDAMILRLTQPIPFIESLKETIKA